MKQEIGLADQFIPLINAGVKTATVRMGRRRYEVGPAELVTQRTRIPIMIEQVSFSHFSELTEQDAKMDGFTHRDELLQTLQTFYPTIEQSSPVTIVRFVRI